MDLDRELERIETDGLTLGWTEERIARYHDLTRQFIEKQGGITYGYTTYGNEDTSETKHLKKKDPKRRMKRQRFHRNQSQNYDISARDKSIRFDFIYMGLTIPELVAKWGLSQAQVYRAIGSMREANDRKTRWRIDSRRA